MIWTYLKYILIKMRRPFYLRITFGKLLTDFKSYHNTFQTISWKFISYLKIKNR